MTYPKHLLKTHQVNSEKFQSRPHQIIQALTGDPGGSFYSIVVYELREDRGVVQGTRAREKTRSSF